MAAVNIRYATSLEAIDLKIDGEIRRTGEELNEISKNSTLVKQVRDTLEIELAKVRAKEMKSLLNVHAAG